MEVADKLLRLNEKCQQAQKQFDILTGELNSLFSTLEEEFGVDNIEEAQPELQRLEKEINTERKKLESNYKEIEDEFNEFESQISETNST